MLKEEEEEGGRPCSEAQQQTTEKPEEGAVAEEEVVEENAAAKEEEEENAAAKKEEERKNTMREAMERALVRPPLLRRTRARYERLQPPPGTLSGTPVPSIEGWVILLTGLPSCTTPEDVESIFVLFKENEPGYFGEVQKVRIPLDRDCLCPGYALVELSSAEGFERALTELPGTPVRIGLDPGATATEETPTEATPTEVLRLGVSPAFLAEEDAEDEPNEPLPGEKRPREWAGEEMDRPEQVNLLPLKS